MLPKGASWGDINVLFFDKKPPSEEAATKELWIYDLRTNQRFTPKERPMTRVDLDDFVACYRSGRRFERVESLETALARFRNVARELGEGWSWPINSVKLSNGAARQDRTVDLSLTKGVLYH